jgi:hypothetical protein
MGRRTRKEIDRMKHTDSGIIIIFYLEPDNTFSTSELFGQTLRHNVYDELRREAWKFVAENFKLNFYPIIEIKKIQPFAANDRMPFIGFNASRFFYATNPQGQMFVVSWNWIADPKKINSMDLVGYSKMWTPGGWSYYNAGREFKPPIKVNDEYTYLPYSEDTWNGVVNLLDTIKKVRERLEELLGSADAGLETFRLAGQQLARLLPGGDDVR